MEALKGSRILVIEDEVLVAMGLQEVLADFGCEVVGPVTQVDDALRIARFETFDAAILDMNLQGKPAAPVAAALRERGIPFLFSTGYGRSDLLAGFQAVPVLTKPYETEALGKALLQVIAGS